MNITHKLTYSISGPSGKIAAGDINTAPKKVSELLGDAQLYPDDKVLYSLYKGKDQKTVAFINVSGLQTIFDTISTVRESVLKAT